MSVSAADIRPPTAHRGVYALLIGSGITAFLCCLPQPMDRVVAEIRNQSACALYLVNFVFCAGIGASAMVFAGIAWSSGVSRLRWPARTAEWTAVVALLLATTFMMLVRIQSKSATNLVRLGTVPTAWRLAVATVYVGNGLALGYFASHPAVVFRLIAFLASRRSPDHRQSPQPAPAVAVIAPSFMTTCAVLGLLLPTSLLFYTVSAWVLAAIRVAPGWQMITGAALVYVSTMISGLAAVVLAMTLARTLLGVQVDLMVVQRLAAVLYIAIPALGFCLFAETARMARAAEPDGTHLFRELVVGPYAAVFWLIQVGGVVLPFLALALPGRLTPGRIGAAALLVMSGIVLERWMLIVPPLLGHAHRLYANGGYHPALAEVLTTAAAYVLAVPAARALKTVAV